MKHFAPGFSNNNLFNKVPLKIKKTGEAIEVWINHTKVAQYPKAVPETMLLNALNFSHSSSDKETIKYYISNIKITKA